MLKNKDFKTIYYSAGNQCYQRKVFSQVNLLIPPVVNRLIPVRELRAVAIKYLVELSVEHEFFGHFFSKRKTCHVYYHSKNWIEPGPLKAFKRPYANNKGPILPANLFSLVKNINICYLDFLQLKYSMFES